MAYNAQVERDGRPAMTDKSFSLALQKLRPNIEKKQRMVAGKLQWCFVGIGMLHPADDSRDSQHSQDKPIYIQRTREEMGHSEECSRGESPKRDYLVNPVNSVNCAHTDIQEFSTHDGYANRQCRLCKAWLPCSREPT